MSTETPQINFSQHKDRAARQTIGYLMQQAIENADCLSLAAGLQPNNIREAMRRLANAVKMLSANDAS